MSEGSSLGRRPHRRGRAGASGLAAFLAIATLGSAASMGAPALAQGCHEFNRFGERWELCRDATGSVERHRIGLLP